VIIFVFGADPHLHEHVIGGVGDHVGGGVADDMRLADVEGELQIAGDVPVRIGDDQIGEREVDCGGFVGCLQRGPISGGYVTSAVCAGYPLISSYVIHIQTMWRQAPITAALVIATGLMHDSEWSGVEDGLHKVAEVLLGSLMGLCVSWLMSRIWPLPEGPAKAA